VVDQFREATKMIGSHMARGFAGFHSALSRRLKIVVRNLQLFICSIPCDAFDFIA